MGDSPTHHRTRRVVKIQNHREQRNPRKREYELRRRRYSPEGCESCTRDEYGVRNKPTTYVHSEPSDYPSCTEKCCYPGQTDSLLDSLRNGFSRIFSGKKRGEAGKDSKLYLYTMSQLKCLDQLLGKLEDETYSIECIIKEASDCDYAVDCNDTRCSLNVISDRVEGLKFDVSCAIECYDPYRDKCEYDLICQLMDRVCCLDALINDLCLQLDFLESRFSYRPPPCEPNSCVRRPACKPDCRKPNCDSYRTPCDPCPPPILSCPKPLSRSPCRPGCGKPCARTTPCGDGCRKTTCCAKPFCESSCNKSCCDKGCCKPKCGPRKFFGGRNLFRTSSVFPVGVMLVKL